MTAAMSLMMYWRWPVMETVKILGQMGLPLDDIDQSVDAYK
jgi:hypothetical protein